MEPSFKKLLYSLGKEISGEIEKQKLNPDEIQEIRITVNKKPVLFIKNKSFLLETDPVSISEIRDIFSSLCEFSVHAYKNEICEGFITSEGGIRTGICGTAIYENEKITGIKDISSLNIRIPHEIGGSADKIMPYLESGILIIGPPFSGKTTILRDFSRRASNLKKVCIVDERGEISGTYRGIPSFDIGFCTVLNNFNKKDGIKNAVRSMSPEIIICDEFGDECDISSAVFAMKSGAKIVASIHASDESDFFTKPFTKEMLKYGIFEHFAFLNKNFEIYRIISSKDIIL